MTEKTEKELEIVPPPTTEGPIDLDEDAVEDDEDDDYGADDDDEDDEEDDEDSVDDAGEPDPEKSTYGTDDE